MAAGNTWLRGFLADADISRISEAVRQAEGQTSGEIVPMIVKRSSAIGHVSLQVCLILLVVFFTIASQVENLAAWAPILAVLVAALLGLGGARIRLIQRWLVPVDDQNFQVQERALLEFYMAGLEKTTGRTGVLIFISLMERQTVVLADKGIASKLPKETWDGVVKTINDSIHNGQTASGLTKAIETCGALLKPHFPREATDKNELSNRLIVKD